MQHIFKHYLEYQGEWPYPNFSLKEVSCKHCGEFYLDHASMEALQELRDMWGKPIVINSGHRCIVHNNNVGGSENSQHLKIAFDCRVATLEQKHFCRMAIEAGFTGIGRYPSRGFVHLDLGPRRTWWK